jgi:hypothetical protein
MRCMPAPGVPAAERAEILGQEQPLPEILAAAHLLMPCTGLKHCFRDSQ